MQDLKSKLQSSLKGAKKVALLGVGSDLRADDEAGILVAQQLEKASTQINKSIEFKVFLGYTAPENLSGEIKKYSPSHVVIVDAADIGKGPGEVQLFLPEDTGGISFSTHKIPVKILAEYLSKSFECRIIIIGIQPKSLEFGGNVSKEVKSSIDSISASVKSALLD